MDALGRAEPEAHDLRERALRGRRLPDAHRRRGSALVAGALSLSLALASFGILRSAFEGGTEVAEESRSPSASLSSGEVGLDPNDICDVPVFDPNVALLGEPFDTNVSPSVGPREFPLEVLEAAGEAADSITGPATDALRAYLAEPQARNAPSERWRAIAQSSDEVIFAAPPSHGSSLDWWVSRFTRGSEEQWRFEHTELVDQHPTPAQLGHGLRLEWVDEVVLRGGRWSSSLTLVNERASRWELGEDSYELMGRAHVFDPSTASEIGHAAEFAGNWMPSVGLNVGARVELPPSLGGALPALGSHVAYDLVACVPELGLASRIGSLRVVENPTVMTTRVLTYPFNGFAMQALGGGRLVVHNGCLAVADRSPRPIYVLWPDGYALVVRQGAVPVLIDAAGREIARLGEDVTLGGGYVPPDNAVSAAIGGIPAPCRTAGEGYFITSGLAAG